MYAGVVKNHPSSSRAAPGLARRLARVVLALVDTWAFRKQDRRAVELGWRVRRPAPLMRIYANVGCTACAAGAERCHDCRTSSARAGRPS